MGGKGQRRKPLDSQITDLELTLDAMASVMGHLFYGLLPSLFCGFGLLPLANGGFEVVLSLLIFSGNPVGLTESFEFFKASIYAYSGTDLDLNVERFFTGQLYPPSSKVLPIGQEFQEWESLSRN